MNPLRKVLFWLHLVIGLAAGGTIAITCFTGATMAFEKQAIAWAEKDARRVTPPATPAEKLSVEELLRRIRKEQPESRLMSLTVFADPAAAVILGLGRTNTVYANPYTGEFTPQGAAGLRAFFQQMLRWHRWLGVNEPPRVDASPAVDEGARAGSVTNAAGFPPRASGPRQLASTVVGISAIVFFTLCITGICLWWPRSWRWKALRANSLVNLRLRGRARDWNWHNAVGLWSAPIIAVMSFTGVAMAFRGFGDFVYGPQPDRPAARSNPAGNPTAVATPESGHRPKGPDALLAIAMQEVPAWESITIRLGPGRQRGSGPAPSQAIRREEGRQERNAGSADGTREDHGLRREKLPREEAASDRSGRSSGGPQPVSVTIRESGSWSPLPIQLKLHPFTGEILEREHFGEAGLRTSFRRLNRTLHTGEAGGWPGQCLALMGCLGGLVLIYSGFALACRRFFPGRTRLSTAHGGNAAFPAEAGNPAAQGCSLQPASSNRP